MNISIDLYQIIKDFVKSENVNSGESSVKTIKNLFEKMKYNNGNLGIIQGLYNNHSIGKITMSVSEIPMFHVDISYIRGESSIY